MRGMCAKAGEHETQMLNEHLSELSNRFDDEVKDSTSLDIITVSKEHIGANINHVRDASGSLAGSRLHTRLVNYSTFREDARGLAELNDRSQQEGTRSEVGEEVMRLTCAL